MVSASGAAKVCDLQRSLYCGHESTYFGQVLHALGLARARRARGAAAQVQVQRAGEGEPAPAGERRDHQPGGAAQVLVAVGKARVPLAYVAQLLLFIPFILQMSRKKYFKCSYYWGKFFFFSNAETRCRLKNETLIKNRNQNIKITWKVPDK